MKTIIQAILKEVPRIAAIAAASLVLAIVANAVHPMHLPLVISKSQPGLPKWIASRFQFVDAQEAKRLLDNHEVLVVDTRDERDFLTEHIPGAIFLPYHGFNEHYPPFVQKVAKDKRILLYCYGSDCGLAARVGKRLITNGYLNITILRRGIKAWKAANLPLEMPAEHK